MSSKDLRTFRLEHYFLSDVDYYELFEDPREQRQLLQLLAKDPKRIHVYASMQLAQQPAVEISFNALPPILLPASTSPAIAAQFLNQLNGSFVGLSVLPQLKRSRKSLAKSPPIQFLQTKEEDARAFPILCLGMVLHIDMTRQIFQLLVPPKFRRDKDLLAHVNCLIPATELSVPVEFRNVDDQNLSYCSPWGSSAGLGNHVMKSRNNIKRKRT